MKQKFFAFLRDRREGQIALTGALLFTMVAGAVGGAIDFSNGFNRRADLQRAADAAAITGAAHPDMDVGRIRSLAEDNLRKSAFSGDAEVTATRNNGLVDVEIEASVPTVLLSTVGIDGLDMGAKAVAEFIPANGGKIEVALVLDTTESMADDMDELRNSALELVDTLFNAAGENVKVSVVPYVASVNIGTGNAQMAWMDTTGDAPWHGISQEGWDVTNCNGYNGSGESCWQACGCPGKPACGGGDDGASLTIDEDGTRYAGSILKTLLGTTSAQAAGSNPYPEPDPAVCPIKNPSKINYFDLFDLIPNAQWGGCVEARPMPHDVSDAPPTSAAQRFVPYFWLDEADFYGEDASNTWANDWIDDDAGPAYDPSVQYFAEWGDRRRNNVWKFDGIASATVIEGVPDMTGPNRACPDPLSPLTNDRAAVEAKINALTHREGGGTIISEGLMWGWRTLSPGAPFTEGAEYEDDQTRKIIVLMSDGANQVVARNDASGVASDDSMGDYTAYGFAREYDTEWGARGLIDSDADASTSFFEQVRGFLDSRTQQACANVKAANPENPIEIYTLLVGDSDDSTAALMQSCATTPDNHYKEVSEIDILSKAFREVAKGIVGQGGSRLVH